MLNIVTIEDAIYTWVNGVTGIQTIFAYPNAPRPLTSYALINFFSILPVGNKEQKGELLGDNTVDIDRSSVSDISISINVYYSGAYQIASQLVDSLDRVTVLEDLYAQGLGYKNTTQAQKIPEEIDKRWEERAQFDCSFYARTLDTENLNTIAKVELTNEIDGTTTIIQ